MGAVQLPDSESDFLETGSDLRRLEVFARSLARDPAPGVGYTAVSPE